MPKGGRLLIRSREGTDWASAGDPARREAATTRDSAAARGLVLTVADTGSGISPEAQARIFEAFFTTKGFGGTGLGLWISKEIMDRHHGRIRVRSSQQPHHRGTVFTLFLPFDSNPTPDPGPTLPA
jgi:signal transduction histidine kinase